MKKCIVVKLPTGHCGMELNDKHKYVPVTQRDVAILEKYTKNQANDVSVTPTLEYEGWVYVNPYYGIKEGEFEVFIQYDKWPDGGK